MSRRRWLLVGGIVAVVIAGAVAVFVVTKGSPTVRAAALDEVSEGADRGTAKLLVQQNWGDGWLVLVGYDRRGVRRLGIGFAAKGLRGWRVASFTEKQVEPDDVQGVGSLLIATSQGGKGQPAWSAAVGEVTDRRIDKIEVSWASGRKSIGARNGDAYLVVERGSTKALRARYLTEDGAEIAPVPISSS